VVPTEFPYTLTDCPPGPFIPVEYPNSLCMKSEYHSDREIGGVQAFNQVGEYYGSDSLVYPVILEDMEI
jgi:hypothetical protein